MCFLYMYFWEGLHAEQREEHCHRSTHTLVAAKRHVAQRASTKAVLTAAAAVAVVHMQQTGRFLRVAISTATAKHGCILLWGVGLAAVAAAVVCEVA